jgi:hypothetical protein
VPGFGAFCIRPRKSLRDALLPIGLSRTRAQPDHLSPARRSPSRCRGMAFRPRVSAGSDASRAHPTRTPSPQLRLARRGVACRRVALTAVTKYPILLLLTCGAASNSPQFPVVVTARGRRVEGVLSRQPNKVPASQPTVGVKSAGGLFCFCVGVEGQHAIENLRPLLLAIGWAKSCRGAREAVSPYIGMETENDSAQNGYRVSSGRC